MAFTLRDMQKLLSGSKRDPGGRSYGNAGAELLGKLGKFVGGQDDRFRKGFVRNGCVVNTCNCTTCLQNGRAVDVQSRVDSWVSKYGPHAELAAVLAAEQAAQQPPQSGGQGGQQQQPPPGQPQSGCSGQASSPGGQESAQQTGSAPSQPPRQPAQPAPAKTQAQQEAAQAKAAYEAAMRLAKGQPKNSVARQFAAQARKKLKAAKRKASFNKAAMASSPSLSARKHLSSSHGRLRRVPHKLRGQMAELINRLVSQAGTTGSQLGTVPVLSATKLVKRMLVRRPLANALKEDSISGRPVTLFLPDVSPSCEAQAQIACDLANAASYAGLTGSDVLVFPHANGHVDAHEDYFPWLNGKPLTTDVKEIPNLFLSVMGGESRFTVRVVVYIGDHDAVDRYGSIAELKTVRRAVWLHNFQSTEADKRVVPMGAGSFLFPDWSPEAGKKLSMVAGCTSMGSMLRGFDLALRRTTQQPRR